MKKFIPNRKFRRDYDRVFKKDPVAANMMLLLCELADASGRVVFPGDESAVAEALAVLMAARFNDPEEYAL